MRNIIILRGAPGCGKSRWIHQNNLEPWTLSSDNIRMLISGPELSLDGKFAIPQSINNKTFEMLYSLLEGRMKKGELVIIDATHSKVGELGTYNKLAREYRYRKFYIQFNTPVEECITNDKLRPEYKQIPEKAIRKVHQRISDNPMPEGWTRIDEKKFWESIDFNAWDFSEYEAVEVFGDIHGCYEPIKNHFKEYPFNEKTKYIFVGDYIDRGIQNKEVLEFLLSIYDKPNVTLLEGNHEKWLKMFAANSDEEIKSHEFTHRTFYQISDMDRRELRQLCRKLNQIALFDFEGKRYLISHGGLTSYPEHLIAVSTEQFIKGVGNYKTPVDDIYRDNYSGVVQVHGHRNVSDNYDGNDCSFNLEGKVEFGGFLKILRIEKGGCSVLKYKNDTFITLSDSDFRESSLIQEKVLGNGISSFNFTKDAFFDKKWNDLTCKARGLFMDTGSHKVVARGYEKFFNLGEVNETRLENLSEKLSRNITAYKKENGFLGILSYYDGALMFCSKSTNTGLYADYFREIFNKSDINREEIENYLRDGKHSLVFEVIDIENDPHIIKESKSKIVLLDSICNQMDFKKIAYEDLLVLASKFNCEVKQVYRKFDDFAEFKDWYLSLDTMNFDDIEGVVVECDNFMLKIKFVYYLFWKQMRGVVDALKKYGKVRHLSETEEGVHFYNWIKDNPELWNKDIISLRDIYKRSH